MDTGYVIEAKWWNIMHAVVWISVKVELTASDLKLVMFIIFVAHNSFGSVDWTVEY